MSPIVDRIRSIEGLPSDTDVVIVRPSRLVDGAELVIGSI